MPDCAMCKSALDSDAFSRNQLSKGEARRCKECLRKAEAMAVEDQRVRSALGSMAWAGEPAIVKRVARVKGCL